MVAEPENDRPNLSEDTDDLQRALTPVQERAIIALLNEQTISRAAAAAEVGHTLASRAEILVLRGGSTSCLPLASCGSFVPASRIVEAVLLAVSASRASFASLQHRFIVLVTMVMGGKTTLCTYSFDTQEKAERG